MEYIDTTLTEVGRRRMDDVAWQLHKKNASQQNSKCNSFSQLSNDIDDLIQFFCSKLRNVCINKCFLTLALFHIFNHSTLARVLVATFSLSGGPTIFSKNQKSQEHFVMSIQ